MKKCAEKARAYIGGKSGILLSLYLFAVLSVEFVTTYESDTLFRSFEAVDNAIFIIIRYIIVSLLVSFLVAPLIIKGIDRIKEPVLKSDGVEIDKKRKLKYILIPFAVLLVNYIIYYPGSFDADSITQYNQSFMNSINDWHPAIHTLLAVKLPILLTFHWIGSAVLVQIVFFALAIGYALITVEEYTNRKFALATMLFIVLNPQTRNLFMSPVKDCAFAILALFLITFAVRIYFTDGEWAKKPLNTAALIVIIVFATLVRHNGILFTLPYVFALFFMISKKRAAVIILCVLVMIAGIKYPLYSALKVEPAPQRQVEITGLPMSIIGAAVADTPEALDEETKEFAYKLAPKDVWENKYSYSGYNSIKNEYADNDVIEEYGVKWVVKTALKCFAVSPFASLKGLIKLTEGVYSVNGNYLHYTDPAQLLTVEIPIKGIPVLQKVNKALTIAETVALPHLFMYIGVMHLLLLAGVLIKLRKLKQAKGALFALPVFVYNFGTMLLLTDCADTARFFYYTFTVTPLLLIILLKKREKSSG